MAHPFAAHRDGGPRGRRRAPLVGQLRRDGPGIVAALGLRDARVISQGLTIEVDAGQPTGDALFHVAVPARRWWADIGFT